jgi:hypothetical protein
MKRLTTTLREQQAEAACRDFREGRRELGYGG